MGGRDPQRALSPAWLVTSLGEQRACHDIPSWRGLCPQGLPTGAEHWNGCPALRWTFLGRCPHAGDQGSQPQGMTWGPVSFCPSSPLLPALPSLRLHVSRSLGMRISSPHFPSTAGYESKPHVTMARKGSERSVSAI